MRMAAGVVGTSSEPGKAIGNGEPAMKPGCSTRAYPSRKVRSGRPSIWDGEKDFTKTTKRRVRDDGWRLPDVLWAKIEPLLPARPKHPLGCHNPRVPDRAAMDAIFFVLRTGCQWNALDATGICSSSSAYRRFREWT